MNSPIAASPASSSSSSSPSLPSSSSSSSLPSSSSSSSRARASHDEQEDELSVLDALPSSASVANSASSSSSSSSSSSALHSMRHLHASSLSLTSSSSPPPSSSSSSFSVMTPNTRHHSLLRGLSVKEMKASLSKSLVVTQQWAKEKVGLASSSSSSSFSLSSTRLSRALSLISKIAQSAKSLEKALLLLLPSLSAMLVQNERFSTAVKNLHESFGEETREKRGEREGEERVEENESVNSASLDSNEETEDEASASSSSSSSSSLSTDLPPVFNRRSSIADVLPSSSHLNSSSSSSPLSLRESTSLLPQFDPLTRRVLSARLRLRDEWHALQQELRAFQTGVVKQAQNTAAQYEIDRLHFDACHDRWLQVTAPSSSSSSSPSSSSSLPVSAAAKVAHAFSNNASSTQDDEEYRLLVRAIRQKADAAEATFEHTSHLVLVHTEELRVTWLALIAKRMKAFVECEEQVWHDSLVCLEQQRKGTPLAAINS